MQFEEVMLTPISMTKLINIISHSDSLSRVQVSRIGRLAGPECLRRFALLASLVQGGYPRPVPEATTYCYNQGTRVRSVGRCLTEFRESLDQHLAHARCCVNWPYVSV